MSTITKRVGLLFGINYIHTPDARLNGCINDVLDIGAYLKSIGFDEIQSFTDQNIPGDVSNASIIAKLSNLALRSWKENLHTVWIHYSGHGTYVRDNNNDEEDGQDEALVPSDYQTAGLITDDYLRTLLASFNPSTWVIMITDACHSATMGDMRFLWNIMGPSTFTPTIKSKLECKSRVVMISGCRDNQTSADAYNTVARKYQGALTAALLDTLRQKPVLKNDVVSLVWEVKNLLKLRRYLQVPQLTSSVDFKAPGTNRALFQEVGTGLARDPVQATPAEKMPMWKRVMVNAETSAGMRQLYN